jgi:Chain length determinant protein
VDIKDYLYAIRRRLWLPIALSLVAALLTAGFIFIQPEKYQATATVVVPALSAKGYSTSAVTQYFSTYKDVLTSVPVVDQVNAQTGEKKSDLVAGLSAATGTASSNIIVVSYSGPTKSTVQDVVRFAAIDSLDAILAPQVSAATAETVNSQKALQLANQNLSDFTVKTGLLFPDVDYKFKSQELSQLQVQLTQSHLEGSTKRIRGLTAVVKARQAELVALSSQVIQFLGLQEARSSAEAVNNKAQVDLNAAKAAVASDSDPASVTIKFIGHISRIPEILRFAGVAAGVALLLSLAYLVLMEFLQPAGRPVATGAARRGAIIPGGRPREAVPVAVTAGATNADALDQPDLPTNGTAKPKR